MWWSEIGFMLFPTRICPVCERHRAISRSHFLCSTCQGKAHALSQEGGDMHNRASFPVETVDTSMDL